MVVVVAFDEKRSTLRRKEGDEYESKRVDGREESKAQEKMVGQCDG